MVAEDPEERLLTVQPETRSGDGSPARIVMYSREGSEERLRYIETLVAYGEVLFAVWLPAEFPPDVWFCESGRCWFKENVPRIAGARTPP